MSLDGSPGLRHGGAQVAHLQNLTYLVLEENYYLTL